MKINKKLILKVIFVSVLVLTGPIITNAATTPNLGAAAAYGVLAGTYTNTSAATTINGSVGFTTPPATPPLGVQPYYGTGGTVSQARTDAASALSTGLATQACTPALTFGSPTDLSLLPQPLTPGVYCITGATSIGVGGITLTGAGTYIFRIVGALTSVDNSTVTLSPGVSACDVFWTPTAATTLGANTTFAGTIIDNANAITIGANTVWSGRALSLGAGVVTTGDTVTIEAPTCAGTASINVVKTVINDDGGGTKSPSDFPLFVDGNLVTSGVTNNFLSAATYTVTETSDSNYVSSFSGDCDANGVVHFTSGDPIKFCIVTNNDNTRSGSSASYSSSPVPPLISILKVPSPLALPTGSGFVTYTYTLKNIGTVSVNTIKLVDDNCSSINLISGDTDNNNELGLTETWTYTCQANLLKTTTNTVVATGWANSIMATDIATATVVVGSSIAPPLIHVTKLPNPLTLAITGGLVTYTKKVTNPGTVALSNIRLFDDKCSPVIYVSGDSNSNLKLDTNETWTYTCQANLLKTTTNTVTATGDANGITAKDIAVATVIVASPKLPNTGFNFDGKNNLLVVITLVGIMVLAIGSVVMFIKKRKI